MNGSSLSIGWWLGVIQGLFVSTVVAFCAGSLPIVFFSIIPLSSAFFSRWWSGKAGNPTYQHQGVLLDTLWACFPITRNLPQVIWVLQIFLQWWLYQSSFYGIYQSMPLMFIRASAVFSLMKLYSSCTFALLRIFSYSRSTFNSLTDFFILKVLAWFKQQISACVHEYSGSSWHLAVVLVILASNYS